MFSQSTVCCFLFWYLAVNGVQTLEIGWIIVDPPVRFGRNLQLLCNITCTDNNNSPTKWSIENGGKRSISSNLLSKNYLKYEILASNRGCQLVIKNFGPEDLNVNYTCIYNFSRYSRNLTLNDEWFEYQPNKADIRVYDEVMNSKHRFSANISKAYPCPTCEATFNDKNITSNLQIYTKRIGMFYATELSIQQPITVGTFSCYCTVGKKVVVLREIKFYAVTKSEDSNVGYHISLAFLVSFLVLAIVIFVVIGRKRRMHSTSTKNEHLKCRDKTKKDKGKYERIDGDYSMKEADNSKPVENIGILNAQIVKYENTHRQLNQTEKVRNANGLPNIDEEEYDDKKIVDKSNAVSKSDKDNKALLIQKQKKLRKSDTRKRRETV